MKLKRWSLIFFCLVSGLSAWADAPGIINYQGKLTDQNGNPITDPGIAMEFSLYNVASGGSFLFRESRANVPVDNGVFVVQIGSETAGGIPKSIFQTNTALYLGVKVGADSEMTPRERLVSAPYALAIATGSVGANEIIDSTITLSKVDTANFDTRYSTVAHTHTGLVPGAHQSTHVDGGADRLTGSLTLTTATITGSNFSVGGSTLAVVGGNVGVGVSNPSTVLQVLGSAAQAPLSVSTSVTGTSLYVSTNGNVGIGTTNPNARLTVRGASGGTVANWATASGTTVQYIGQYGGLYITPGILATAGLNLTGTADIVQMIVAGNSAQTSDIFQLRSNGSSAGDLLAVQGGGNVGIGTTTPSYRLHVSSAAGEAGTVFAVSTGPVDLFKVSGTSAALKVPLYFPDGTVQTTAAGAGSQWTTNGSSIGFTSGWVGIGTTAPAVQLVVSDPDASVMRVQDLAQNSRVEIQSGAGSPRIELYSFAALNQGALGTNFVSMNDVALWARGGRYLVFGTDNLERIRIDVPGNVGIGTTTPNYRLHVSSVSGESGPIFAVSTGPVDLFRVSGTSAALKVPLYFPDGTAQTSAYTGGTVAHQSTHVDGGADRLTGSLTLTTATLTGSSFSVGSSTFSVALGRVGVGRTNPQANLEVMGSAGNAAFIVSSGTLASQELLRVSSTGLVGIGGLPNPLSQVTVVSGNDDILRLEGRDGADPLIVFSPSNTAGNSARMGGWDNASSLAELVFITNDVERMRVEYNGDVGIGTTLPSYRMQVSSAAGTTGTVFAVSTGPVDLFKVSGTSAALKVPLYFPDGTVQTTAAGTASQWTTNGSNIGYTGGYVGIGATNPSSDLHVVGDAIFTASAAISGTGLAATAPAFQVVGGTFTILRNGKVGIGTSTPDFRLEVVGSSDEESLFVQNYNVASNPVMSLFGPASSGLTSGKAFAINTQGEANSRFMAYTDGKIGFGSGTASRDVYISRLTTGTLMISNDAANGMGSLAVTDKVGVGTTAPAYRMQISSAAGTTGTIFSVSTGAVDLFRVSGTSAALKVPLYFPDGTAQTSASGAASQWTTNGTNIGYTGGYVGIGATNPSSDLHVVGDAIFTASAAISGTGLSSTNPAFQVIGATFTILRSGKVGIGTTTPAYLLDVSKTFSPASLNALVSLYGDEYGSSGSYNQLNILDINAYTAVTGAGGSEVYAIHSQVGTTSDGVGQGAFGVASIINTYDSADEGFGFFVDDDNGSTGGTQYGMYISLNDTNVTRYGIYQPTANDNWLAGRVGVGRTVPSYQLHVSSAAGTTGTIFAVSTGPVDLFRVLGTSVNVKVPIVFPDGSSQVTAYGTAMVVKGNSGASMTIDWSAGNTQHVTLTGACAFTLSGGVSGMKYTLVLKQNGTGGYVPTWGAEVRWPSGTAPTVTGTANKTTYIGFIYNSVDSKYDGIAVSNDY